MEYICEEHKIDSELSRQLNRRSVVIAWQCSSSYKEAASRVYEEVWNIMSEENKKKAVNRVVNLVRTMKKNGTPLKNLK